MRALPEPLPSSRSGSARRTASLVLSLLLACGALASCRGETPSAPVKGEAPRLVFSLHRLDLDGVGSIDDRAAVFIRGDASTTVEVRLGTGEELSWTYDHPDLAFSRQVLTSAYLSTKDHQALLLQAAAHRRHCRYRGCSLQPDGPGTHSSCHWFSSHFRFSAHRELTAPGTGFTPYRK